MIEDLQRALLSWFGAHARELPWRQSAASSETGGRRDPYRVWISEVLLQQTQVARGLVYFERFLAAFPTVQDLAAAPEEAVLKAWEGCGYYARARNLHKAATILAASGFPPDYGGWLSLPGVGPYTAAAIASIALGEARAVNDGNVRRVLSRVFGQREPTEGWVQARADEVLYAPDPGRWNEAVMDLGATVCTPKNPKCGDCPLREVCAARASGTPEAYPTPKKRAAVKEIEAVALLIGDGERAYLETRAGTLLGGLSGLPLEEVRGDGQAALKRLLERLGASKPRLLGSVTHTMTHRLIKCRVYAAQADLPLSNIAERPLSRLDHKALALPLSAQPALFESA